MSMRGYLPLVCLGAYVGKNKEEIETYFHVHLPGPRDLPAPDQAADHSAPPSPDPTPAK